MTSLVFKAVDDLEQCHELWERFSPKKTVWDFWDIAKSFNLGYSHKPYFIVGNKGGKDIGILPLEKYVDEDGKDAADFFGSDYPERRTFYINDKSLVNDFLKQAPPNTTLMNIAPSEKEFADIEPDSESYSLNLAKHSYDIEKYFQTFSGKHKKNMKHDLKQLEQMDFRTEINNIDDLPRLAKLSIKRFGAESDFNSPQFNKSIQILVENAAKLKLLQLLSIKLDGKTVASEIAFNHNGIYTVLIGGSDPEINNLGKLLNVEHIKNAARLKVPMIDFMTCESGWKKLWNLDQTILYIFTN